VLTFLVLATTTGGPLPPDAVATLTAVRREVLTHRPETRAVWLSERHNVGFAGWQTRPGVVGGSHWHVGDHGLTAVAGAPWPAGTRLGGDTPWASQLSARLDPVAPDLAPLAGAFVLVRFDRDGRGWVAADTTAAGPLYVARSGAVLAVSNRAEVARDAAGLPPVRAPAGMAALPAVGGLVGRAGPYEALVTPSAGEWVAVDPDAGAEVVAGTSVWTAETDADPDAGTGADVDAVAARLRTALSGLAVAPAPRRVLDLTTPVDGRVMLAAADAAGVLDHFELVARGGEEDPPVVAARTLARAVGRPLTVVPPLVDELATVDRWLRAHVGATAAVVPADPAGPPAVRDEALVVGSRGAAMLRPPDPSDAEAADLLAPAARRDLDDRIRAACAAPDLVHLAERLPRLAAADAALAAPATVVDPARAADVARLARTAPPAAGTWQDALVAALSPTVAAVAVDPAPAAMPSWDTLYALFEGELLGRPGGPLDEVLDRDAVRAVLRGSDPPAPSVQARLWAATTAAVWLAHGEAPEVVARQLPEVRVRPRPPEGAPVLVTGVTSRSFIDLAQLKIPLERTARDPLLAVRVDREVAELVDRLLVTVDAALGDLPPDVDARLASDETAGFADAAVRLLARRGGVLADPRLGLTLPFWTAHVAVPRVVLVAERPVDLLARLERPLPAERVLTAWLDVVTATLTTTEGVRCVDPDDIAEGPLGPEGDASAAYPGPDRAAFEELLSVTSVVDSLIRELEVEAVRPIVREVRRARLAARPPVPSAAEARFPLAALEALTQLRGRVGEVEGELAACAADRDGLRQRLEGLRSRRTVRWAVGAARLLGRPPLDRS
jgi:hypothetical protein